MLKRLALGLAITLIAVVGFAPAAGATAIPITTTLDSFGIDNGTCSLREAVQSVNTNTGFSGCTAPDPFASNSIDLVAGQTYTLNLSGPELSANNGVNDLDLLGSVAIRSTGAGTGDTKIVAPAGDRVIEVGGSSGNSLTISGIRITGGSTAGMGGGILDNVSGSSLNLIGATVDGNSAVGDGGGIYSGAGTTLSLTNVTASGNHSDGNGGSVAYNSANGSFIRNSTIVDSSTEGLGAGIANLSSGTVNITNTILAGSNSGGELSECSGTITSGNNNLIGTNNFCTISQPVNNGTDVIGADHAEIPAHLGALGDNGGPVFTRLPNRMSPAINRGYAGVPAAGTLCETTDARNVARPQEGRCDMGAVEVQPPGPQTLTVNTSADQFDGLVPGSCGLREAVTATNNNQATGGCPAGSFNDTINLGPGTYMLSRAGVDDINVLGDLDLLTLPTDTINIVATGGGQTTIDGNGAVTNDRVLQGSSSVFGSISGVNIQNGKATGNGGGLENAGELDLSNVTVSGNTATGDGGGIYFANNTFGDIENSTVSGNQANGNGGGIASANTVNTTPRLHNVTVTGNTAANGGGLLGTAPGFPLSNTIVAGNTDASGGEAPDCAGTISSTGYNLIGTNGGCTLGATTGDQVGSNVSPLAAGLSGLANNGGTSLTHAPVLGSLVLNAGNPAAPFLPPACLQTDQIGTVRPLNGRCDIGALESNPSPVTGGGTLGGTTAAPGAKKKCKKKAKKTAVAAKRCKKKKK